MQETEGATTPSLQGLVNYVKPSKEAIYSISEAIAVSVDEGRIDPVTADTKMKFLIETLTQAREKIKSQVVDAVSRAGKAGVQHYGATIELMESGIKYDYSQCNDRKYNETASEIEKLDKVRKEREKFLKSLTASVSLNDPDTGEVHDVHPPQRTSTTTIKTVWK